nr:hypothetical protein [Lachnospiraceae bacterium]
LGAGKEPTKAEDTSKIEETSKDAAVSKEEHKDEASESAGSEDSLESFTSPDGWTVSFDKNLIESSEIDEHSQQFVYIGDSAGTNMLTISYVEGKQPEELLYETTESWGDDDKIERTEGFFPGTDDKWGYWRELPALEEGSGLSQTAIAGQYGDGVLQFEIISHMGEDEDMNMAVSDHISAIMDSISYKDFPAQSMYEGIAGVYVRPSEGFVDTITLNEDHTGMLSFQDDIPINWGSIEIVETESGNRYEYDVEGDAIMLNLDGEWLEFSKAASPEDYVGSWVLPDDASVKLTVTAKDSDDGYDILIVNEKEGDKGSSYKMTGHYREEDGSLQYEDCSKLSSKDGEVLYENGKGWLLYSPVNEKLVWTDNEIESEYIDDSYMTFEKDSK